MHRGRELAMEVEPESYTGILHWKLEDLSDGSPVLLAVRDIIRILRYGGSLLR